MTRLRTDDLHISVANFNLMVGLAWQLPDDALVCLCVGESRTLFRGEAHCGAAEADYDPPTHAGLSHYQHLVVRAGPWEFEGGLELLRAMAALGAKASVPVKVRFGRSSVIFEITGELHTLKGDEAVSLKVVTDLNEVNKVLALAWQEGDDARVVVAVAPPAYFQRPALTSWDVVLALRTAEGATCFARCRAPGYDSVVNREFRLGDLREVCRRAAEQALKDPHDLGASEAVTLAFPKGAMTVHCGGQAWTVREGATQNDRP